MDFPRGLLQPSTGHRFAVDSLLLACFVKVKEGERLLDLGCGCGVISFGILLKERKKNLHITGVEKVEEMVDMAEENARGLGLSACFEVIHADIREIIKGAVLKAETFDRVVCNPPYRKESRGRISPYHLKNLAHFQGETTVEDFIRAGVYCVKNRGKFYVSYASEGLAELFSLLKRHRAEPKRMRFVHGHRDNPSKVVLVEAVKNGKQGLIVEPPLILYRGNKGENIPEEDALSFCPFLK